MFPDISSAFEAFRAELDDFSDRRERLIKVFFVQYNSWVYLAP